MTGKLTTHIFCYDDYRSFSDDVKKRFSDTFRYKVSSFVTTRDLIANLEEDKEHALCKVAIIGMHDNKEQIREIIGFIEEIIKIEPAIGIILLIPADKVEDVKKIMKFNISAYIPRNSNSILRIHNIVKKLISENSIIHYRKKSNFSITVVLIFVIVLVLMILIARFKLPLYF